MDEIENRLRETSEACFSCYETWRKDQKDSAAREALNDAIHELRRVASRLEIELALSEREEIAQRPIPIPPHRAKSPRNRGDSRNDGDQHSVGNSPASEGKSRSKSQRRRGPRKAASGGAE